MEETVGLLMIALFANKVIELLKNIRAKNWNTVFTLLILFVAGVAALTVAAHSAVTEHMLIPGVAVELGLLDAGSLVLLGLMITSTGSTIYDFKKAFDNSDSAVQPKLLGPPSP